MRFLDALRRQPVDRTPVWFMRQAGRYQPQYRAMRERHSLLEICRQPQLAAQVTLLPVDELGVDAAIIFGDLLLPLEGMGVAFEFRAGNGPHILQPLRGRGQLERLPRQPDLPVHTLEAIRMAKEQLRVPLIGFAGAPFTLGSYLVEGGASRTYQHAKGLMLEAPALFGRLMDYLARLALRFLLAQAEAGADAVQLFDSWAGALAPHDYREHVLPHTRGIFQGLARAGVPAIYFATGTGGWLELMAQTGAPALSIDWRLDLAEAWERIGHDRVIQGNLDPVALLGPPEPLELRVRNVLRQAAGRPGHVFNLGHGILPGTPVENVRTTVELVHELSLSTQLASPEAPRP